MKTLRLKFGRDFEAAVWSTFWSVILTNLWYDLRYSHRWKHSTLGSVVPEAMLLNYHLLTQERSHPPSRIQCDAGLGSNTQAQVGNKDWKAKVGEQWGGNWQRKERLSRLPSPIWVVQVTRSGRWRFAKIMRSTVSKWSGTLLGEDMGDTFNYHLQQCVCSLLFVFNF